MVNKTRKKTAKKTPRQVTKKKSPSKAKTTKTPTTALKSSPLLQESKSVTATMKKARSSTHDVKLGIAIAALLINVLVFPGVGSLIGKRIKEGVWQIVLFVLGIPLCLVLIGIPMILASWIWGIVTGVQLLSQASE